MSYDRDDDLRDHFRRNDELTRRHLENKKRSHDLNVAIRKRQWDRADYILGIPPTSQESQHGPTTDFVPRLHAPIDDLDLETVKMITSIQVDPTVSSEDKEALTLMCEMTGIAKHIERLKGESPPNSAKIRYLQQKEKQLQQTYDEVNRAILQGMKEVIRKVKRQRKEK